MFYTNEQLKKIGFKTFGQNVLISDKCSIYGADKIEIGSNVRIDDFCLLSSGTEIIIGDYVHIACYASLIGKGRIVIGDFSGIAARCNILSSCDDFSGEFLQNPMIPEKYLNVYNDSVIINKHCVLGVGTVVLPGVTIPEGVAIGSMSFIKNKDKSFKEYEIWAGNPLKYIKKRQNNLICLEKKLREEDDLDYDGYMIMH